VLIGELLALDEMPFTGSKTGPKAVSFRPVNNAS
jgi:hypothetical protein